MPHQCDVHRFIDRPIKVHSTVAECLGTYESAGWMCSGPDNRLLSDGPVNRPTNRLTDRTSIRATKMELFNAVIGRTGYDPPRIAW